MVKGGQAKSSGNRSRIAILPFANISADPRDSYFADGMTEELISTMSKLNEISVISRTSVMHYKKKTKTIKEIGRELNAGTVLEGSVRKSGNRVRIAIQAVDVERDVHLWAESYDRDLRDIFAIQSDIAQQVAEALRIRLLPSEKSDIERRPTEKTEAYKLYLEGRYFWNARSRAGIDKAVTYFQRSVKLDSNFALAYAGLADCYLVYSDYGWLRPSEGYPRVKEFSLKAIEMDPRLAEAHASLGWLYSTYEWRWLEAKNQLLRAIDLKPSYATTYQWYALFLAFVNKPTEALDQIKRAMELDPLSRIIRLNLGHILMILRRWREAIEHCKRVVEAYPDYADAHRSLGFAYYMDSRISDAVEEVKKAVVLSSSDPFMVGELGTLLGLVGRRDEAGRILEELKALSKTTYVPSVEIAQTLLCLGKADEAFDYLRKIGEDRSSRFLYFRVWPWFEEFRKDSQMDFYRKLHRDHNT